VPGHAAIAVTGALSLLSAAGPGAAASLLTPGLYQVEVRVALPNVQNSAAPFVVTHWVSRADLESGRAFFLLSDNPLRRCDLLDFEAAGEDATYRIACPGPNRGSALAAFKTAGTGYRGTIHMNLGGKNMTLTESQIGKRIGDCR
jgi:hypothetical protein